MGREQHIVDCAKSEALTVFPNFSADSYITFIPWKPDFVKEREREETRKRRAYEEAHGISFNSDEVEMLDCVTPDGVKYRMGYSVKFDELVVEDYYFDY